MNDFEKNRAEYVQRLETQLQQLQHDLGKYRPLAEKWNPVIESSQSYLDGEIALRFGGKVKSVKISNQQLTATDVTGLVTAIAGVFAETIFTEQIRDLIEPHIVSLQNTAKAVENVNKW